MAHAAVALVEPATSSGSVTPEHGDNQMQTTIPGLTPEQTQHLLSLIEVPKARCKCFSGKTLWMFASGASCHMTGNAEEL